MDMDMDMDMDIMMMMISSVKKDSFYEIIK
jgi:hypothetical protein